MNYECETNHDLHVHTYLSSCCINKAGHTPRSIIELAEKMGVTTIGFADHVWATPAIPLDNLMISCIKRELEVPYYVRDNNLDQLIDELKQKGENTTYFEKNIIKRVEQWQNDGKTDRFNISCMRIGDIAIVAMPDEIFTGWGLEIKRYSPARQTFIIELASSPDGLTGYRPTSDQALRAARGKGAYGALPILSLKHCPTSGQMMTDAVISILHELWPE